MLVSNDKINRLSSTAIFSELDQCSLEELLPEFEWIRLSAGDTLFREGDYGEALYVVLSGRLRASIQRGDGLEEVVGDVALGECVGELAILTGEPRAATVRAIRDTNLAKLSSSSVNRLLERNPQTVMRLARLIAKRQREAMFSAPSERSQVCTITILRTDQSSLARAFVDRLVQTLHSAGSTAYLNYESTLERFGIRGDRNEAIDDRIIAWLNDVELSHRFVIYEADTDAIWWTQLCLRQADRILTVVPSGTDIWRLQFKFKNLLPPNGTMPRNELIVVHSSSHQAIAGTTRLLSDFHFERHHHIDVTSNEDFKRLGRLLTGKSVGLVLSGGGARGFAHIGVIRALSEWKVPFDWVGGTSMGALIAAQQALGWDWQTMLTHNKKYWNKYNPQRDYTLPIVAINSGRKLNRMLRSMYGNVRIEDLKTNFFCVSTNLSRAEIVVYQKGSLRKALRASLSIPGIGPPVFSNGELFVDGGLLNNLPIDVMSKLCQGRVLAVDVTSRVELLTDVKNAETLSGWKILGRRLNPWAKRRNVPSLFAILQRATMLNSIRFTEAAKCQADLYFNPPVSQFGLFDWQKIEQIAETGYVFAVTKLTGMADQVSEKIER